MGAGLLRGDMEKALEKTFPEKDKLEVRKQIEEKYRFDKLPHEDQGFAVYERIMLAEADEKTSPDERQFLHHLMGCPSQRCYFLLFTYLKRIGEFREEVFLKIDYHGSSYFISLQQLNLILDYLFSQSVGFISDTVKKVLRYLINACKERFKFQNISDYDDGFMGFLAIVLGADFSLHVDPLKAVVRIIEVVDKVQKNKIVFCNEYLMRYAVALLSDPEFDDIIFILLDSPFSELIFDRLITDDTMLLNSVIRIFIRIFGELKDKLNTSGIDINGLTLRSILADQLLVEDSQFNAVVKVISDDELLKWFGILDTQNQLIEKRSRLMYLFLYCIIRSENGCKNIQLIARFVPLLIELNSKGIIKKNEMPVYFLHFFKSLESIVFDAELASVVLIEYYADLNWLIQHIKKTDLIVDKEKAAEFFKAVFPFMCDFFEMNVRENKKYVGAVFRAYVEKTTQEKDMGLRLKKLTCHHLSLKAISQKSHVNTGEKFIAWVTQAYDHQPFEHELLMRDIVSMRYAPYNASDFNNNLTTLFENFRNDKFVFTKSIKDYSEQGWLIDNSQTCDGYTYPITVLLVILNDLMAQDLSKVVIEYLGFVFVATNADDAKLLDKDFNDEKIAASTATQLVCQIGLVTKSTKNTEEKSDGDKDASMPDDENSSKRQLPSQTPH